jgi:CheY-like chemotaxis protein
MSPRERDLFGTRIVYLDDDADTRDALQTTLQLAGSKVRTASTARDALQLLAVEWPDVVITDLALPGEDGYAFLGALQKFAGERGHPVPVIALTGAAEPEDRQRVSAAGFALHLTKPVDPTELVEAVAMTASGRAREFARKRPQGSQGKG